MKALIFGINGQDGSYLAELLLKKGYRVFGWIPDNISVTLENIDHILKKISLTKGNLLDQKSIQHVIEESMPDEIYNFASPSFPATSWDDAVKVGDIVGLGVSRLLDAIRIVQPGTHFYQASSSEMFGLPNESPQSELTPFHPRNPYGVAKLYAHWMTVNYRHKYNLFAVSGILFNHESPRRGFEFVTRKITHEAVRIKLGVSAELQIGNIDTRRDWGYAGDYVEAIWMMLNHPQPQDFVIGTGETHTVREFLDEAFSILDLDWHQYVKINPNLYRVEEGKILQSNPSKAWNTLGWHHCVTFKELVRLMVQADFDRYQGSSNYK